MSPERVPVRVAIGQCDLWCGKAEEVLPTLTAGSVNLILTDPPYYRVKTQYLDERIEWDRQWPDREAYLAWLRHLAKEWQRVLAPNGSLYCFASPHMAAWVEVTLSESFHVLQRITWRKPPYSTKAEMFDKDSMRMYFPASEALIFAEQLSEADSLKDSAYQHAERGLKTSLFSAPIAAAMAGTKTSAKDVTEAIGAYGKVNHGGAVSNWLQGYNIPTREQYARMRRFFNERAQQQAAYLCQEYDYLRREYDELRQEYEGLRQEYEALRRPFTITPRVPYTDVWDFETVGAAPGKHPAEKPVPLLRHIIEASSRPGDLVLDCCMGRGSTLEAAYQCGRRAIGIDQDPHWWTLAQRRLSQLDLFAPTYAEVS